MLIASLDGCRVDAAEVVRGPDYRCPDCRAEVILKKGRRVIHHFAHRPHSACVYGYGESLAHLEAKRVVHDAFTAAGLRAEIESCVPTLPGDRRADVMVWAWTPNGKGVAFELQHSAIGLDQIEARAFSYARAGIAQIWIPFLPPRLWADAERLDVDRFRLRFAPRTFERWIHGLNGAYGMWLYDPPRRAFWHGRLRGYELWREETTWYDEYGDEQHAGGYWRWSQRWRNLDLTGPFQAAELSIHVEWRRAFETDRYRWPDGPIARLRVERPQVDSASRVQAEARRYAEQRGLAAPIKPTPLGLPDRRRT
jgi:competence protein CoiA